MDPLTASLRPSRTSLRSSRDDKRRTRRVSLSVVSDGPNGACKGPTSVGAVVCTVRDVAFAVAFAAILLIVVVVVVMGFCGIRVWLGRLVVF